MKEFNALNENILSRIDEITNFEQIDCERARDCIREEDELGGILFEIKNAI